MPDKRGKNTSRKKTEGMKDSALAGDIMKEHKEPMSNEAPVGANAGEKYAEGVQGTALGDTETDLPPQPAHEMRDAEVIAKSEETKEAEGGETGKQPDIRDTRMHGDQELRKAS